MQSTAKMAKAVLRDAEACLHEIEEVVQLLSNQFECAEESIEEAYERLLHKQPHEKDEIEICKTEAQQQLASASKLFKKFENVKTSLKETKTQLKRMIKQLSDDEGGELERAIENCIERAEALIGNFRELDHSTEQFMWCSFSNALPKIPVKTEFGRCFPYNVLRTHVGNELSVVEVPNVNSTDPIKGLCAAFTLLMLDSDGQKTHLSIPSELSEAHLDSKHGDMFMTKRVTKNGTKVKICCKTLTSPEDSFVYNLQSNCKDVRPFDNSEDQLFLVVLETCGDEQRVQIYDKNANLYVLASTLIPRSFEPVDVCFGPDNYLFVAEESTPRVVVFQIEPKGKVWQYIRTINLPETLRGVSVITVDPKWKHLWIGTTDGKLFRSEDSITNLMKKWCIQPNQGLPPGNYKCDTPCDTCNEMEDGARSFKRTRTGDTFPINDRLTCESSSVVYLVTCIEGAQYVGTTKRMLHHRMSEHRSKSKPTAVYTHFTTNQHSSADKTVNVITYVPTEAHKNAMEIIETMWMNKLDTWKQTGDLESGMNQKRSLRPRTVQTQRTYKAIKEVVSQNYHVLSGALNKEYREYFPLFTKSTSV